MPWKSTLPAKDPIYLSHEPNDITQNPDKHAAYEMAHGGNNYFKLLLQEYNPNPASHGEVTYMDWGFGTNISVVPPHTFQNFSDAGNYYDEEGHEYLTWGWWLDEPGNFDGLVGDNGLIKFFAAAQRIWHIQGYRTHTDYIDYLQQQNFQATYIGEAKGVYADSYSTDVTVLTGTCQFDINFGTRQITNTEIDVDDGEGGHLVHMWNGSGTLSSDGTFGVKFTQGTINGSNISPSPDSYANGAVFGPQANGVGGVWRAHDGGDKWATGEFHAQR